MTVYSIISRLLDILFPEPAAVRTVRTLTTLSSETSLHVIGNLSLCLTLSSYQTSTVRAAIHIAKYRNDPHATALLGTLLSEHLLEVAGNAALMHPVAVVPIPSSQERLRERGFDHLASILAATKESVPSLTPLCTPQLLQKTRHTKPQTHLTKEERKTNLRDAFTAGEGARGMHIILIDDVLTTGATVTEAARALTRAGAAHVSAVVIARAHA